jgi:hypothetical protein
MGFNTTVLILNDYLHCIAEDKEFGRKLYEAVCELDARGVPDCLRGKIDHGAQVIETHHADYHHAIIVGGNMAQDAGYAAHWTERLDMRKTEDRVKLLKSMARDLGYSLHKLPQK